MSTPLPLCAETAWWLTGWLRGVVPGDDLLDGVPVSLDLAADLRASGATGVGLALPVPGDPLGLGGPPEFNVAAQAAAIEALKHQDAVAERVERAVVARVEVEAGLDRLGIRPAESQANFCWFDLPEAADEDTVVAGLRERGVLVRAGRALGREGALRVTYGTPEQNQRFLAALGELL